MDRHRYGQYCPLSMATEILATRWTLLILRELLEGSSSFNDISRGVPLMSRTLLSQRLKDLVAAGVASREEDGPGRPVHYRLTNAGLALGPIVRSIALWGQEWIDTEPSLEDIDTDFLMWDMRRNVRPQSDMPPRFTVHFHFPDAPAGKTDHWLVFEHGEVDICYVDPGHEIDIGVEATRRVMTEVWMGWRSLHNALEDGTLIIDGVGPLARDPARWLGLSSVADQEKRPQPQRVMRNIQAAE